MIGTKLPFGQCCQPWPHYNCRGASRAPISRHQRLLVEDIARHGGQFLHQPVLPVVVVEHHHPVAAQVRARRGDGVLGEQEAFQTQAGVVGGERQGVGQGENNQIIVLGRILQETAPIIDDHVHPRTAVGFIRVELSAKLLDRGINLDRCDRINAILQSERRVRAGPGSKNERVVERPAAEDAVDLLVERLPVLPGNHRLVPGAVDIDKVAGRNGGTEDNFIVWRPVGADLELTHLDERGNQEDCYKEHRAFRAEQQQEGAQDGEPDQRRQREVGYCGEDGDSCQAADDIIGVGGQWR